MSDLTFKEAVKLIREADDICYGRLCSECPFGVEDGKCLNCQVPTSCQLKHFEDTLINLKNAIHAFKEGSK